MDDYYQIYLITNIKNNKQYIGQVSKKRGYKTRFVEHICGVKYANTRLLSNSIKKYGKDNFIIELLADDIPETAIDDLEKYYIKKYNTRMPQGYNMTEGGQGIHGYKHTEEDKRKISKRVKYNWSILKNDPEKLLARNNKISLKLKGTRKSAAARKKYSEAAKDRFKDKHGTFFGKKHSIETKHKIAEKNGHKIGMYDKNSGKLLKEFLSAMEASRWLVDNKYTANNSAFTRIITVCNEVKGQGKTAYGYV